MLRFQNFAQNILNSPLTEWPWPHQLTENAIDPDDLKWLTHALAPLQTLDSEGQYISFTINDLESLGIKCRSEFQLLVNNVHAQKENLIRQYRKGFPDSSPELITEIMVALTPPDYEYVIHDEHRTKIWTSVVYISPDRSIGTNLYTANNKLAHVCTTPWIPGAAFTFCKKPRQTWHNFKALDKNRITVNIFVKILDAKYPEHLALVEHKNIVKKLIK
jgi:hypothetical protein